MDDWMQLLGILWWPIGIALSAWVSAAMAQRPLKQMVKRLLRQDPEPSSQKWLWPGPESYALLCGPDLAKNDAFKVGLLQLVAEGILVPDYVESSKTKRRRETILRAGSVSPDRVSGSLAAIYRLWEGAPDPKTLAQLAQQAKLEYGSLARFAEREVITCLNDARLVARRGDLESRVSQVLRNVERQGSQVERDPRQTLMAAAVAVAEGRTSPLEDSGPLMATQQPKQETVLAAMSEQNATTGAARSPWLDWIISNEFQQVFAQIDSGYETGAGADGLDGDGADSMDFEV